MTTQTELTSGTNQQLGRYRSRIVGGTAQGGGAKLIVLVVIVAVLILAAVFGIPAYQDRKVIANLDNSLNLTAPHRVALGVACAEGALEKNRTNKDYGLSAPERYSGTYTKSVSISVPSDTQADVTIVYRAIGSAIKEGQTAIYRGTCRAARMTWTADGTVEEKYWPKT